MLIYKICCNIIYNNVVIYILEIVIVLLPVLLSVAYITIAERKTMASMQRRLGPNVVGIYGLLQPFADALKLLIKEYVSPTQANIILFFLGPMITLTFSLYGYAMIPFGPGIAINDFNLGIFYMLAVSSLATYGILLAGWSANSKYAFLGSLRSTAQLISYELILSSALLLIILNSASLNLTVIIEMQKSVWFVFLLLPLFIIFVIASIAENNRAPFDLAEAESELVSGFMTEHAASIFVFFFLAEYASIILMCILISIVLLGGYEIFSIVKIFNDILYSFTYVIHSILYNSGIIGILSDSLGLNSETIELLSLKYTYNIYLLSIFNNLSLGIKTCVFIFIYIWVRASYPRIRFDQLMSFCWTISLPIIIAIVILFPCIMYNESIYPFTFALL